MRPMTTKENPIDANDRLSELSIVIEDFDSAKSLSRNEEATSEICQRTQRPYTRQSSDASIKKILEEAEHRKHEFWKLIDEHSAVIENLKKIEQLENGALVSKSTPVAAPIKT